MKRKRRTPMIELAPGDVFSIWNTLYLMVASVRLGDVPLSESRAVTFTVFGDWKLHRSVVNAQFDQVIVVKKACDA